MYTFDLEYLSKNILKSMDKSDVITSSQQAIEMEDRYGAHNYHPIPVVIARGEGVFVWDVEGNKYYDFLSAYSAVNQGHSHPRIVESLVQQSHILALTSRAYYNNVLGQFEKYITEYFDFDKVLPMNTGAEAVETAIKICRKWAYEVKGVPDNQAKIIVCENNFHGRTTTIISFSNDPEAHKNYGPYTPGFIRIPYNDIAALEKILNEDYVAGFLVEPIQGEAGVITPDDNYITKAYELCKKKNILFMADEIQTGLSRTGSLLAMCGNCTCKSHCEKQASYRKPDILILGKALSGGLYPVSAVLADNEIMAVMQPGQHGSTYGGNPLGCRIAITALEVLKDEKLAQNARRLGDIFRKRLRRIVDKSNIIREIRGKGLLNAIEIYDSPESSSAWKLCLVMKEKGLLAKPTHGNIIRFAPPLIINEKQLHNSCDIIESSISDFEIHN